MTNRPQRQVQTRAAARRLSAAALGAAICLFPALSPAGAEPPPPVPLERNCFYVLAKGSGDTIQCMYPAWLTDEERADLKRITRGFLEDARCRIDVRIERRQVEDALAAADHVFEAPPQPVVCEITTPKSTFAIEGTFAPKVVFKGGEAVEATPNLANVTGINPYVAWPVVHFINTADRIKGPMLRMINAYRARVRAENATVR